MNFTFETEGTSSFLVYSLEAGDTIDSLGFGMLTNNQITDVLPLIFARKNADRFFRYNISSKLSLASFLSRTMNRKRVVSLFSSLCSALLEAQEYLLEPATFITDPAYMFVDISTSTVSLIGIPLLPPVEQKYDLRQCCKEIIFGTQFDQSEDCSYVTKIINFLNQDGSFSLPAFREMLLKLQKADPRQATAPTGPVDTAKSVSRPRAETSAPGQVAGFGATSSIQGSAPVYRPPSVTPPPAPATPFPPADAFPEEKSSKGLLGGLFGNKQEKKRPNKNNDRKKAAKKQKAVKAPVQNASMGFAIPGMSPAGTPGSPPASAPGGNMAGPAATPPPSSNSQADEAAFKAFFSHPVGATTPQKKAKHSLFKKADPPAPVVPNFIPPAPASVPSAAAAPAPVQTPPPAPVYHREAAPITSPNFGSTTVLDAEHENQTTSLSGGNPAQQAAHPVPFLIRQKNGERIPVNKLIFSIGKEKTFVDYFISDNESISRNHANIITRGNEYYIEDTNSMNHTYVDGVLIPSNQKVRLQDGVDIRLANEHFAFSLK